MPTPTEGEAYELQSRPVDERSSSSQYLKHSPSGDTIAPLQRHDTVDLHTFDPSGVNELGRTLSRVLTNGQRDTRSSGGDSNETYVTDKDGFDLEKALRHYMRQCVFFLSYFSLKLMITI